MTNDNPKKDSNGPEQITEEGLLKLSRLAEIGLSLSAVVHEAKQPLSSIKLALQFLEPKIMAVPGVGEYLDDALEGVRRLDGFLENADCFFRSSSDDMAPANLDEPVRTVVALLEADLRNKGLKLTVDIEKGLHEVNCIRGGIEQLIFNLLTNARDAVSEGGGGRIGIFLREGPGDTVELMVADDGIGIDPANREKLFLPGFTTKSRGNGTGMGLYIVKHIVEIHGAGISLLTGGEIPRDTDRGYETGFLVRFRSARRETAASVGVESTLKTKRGLVVDDERVILKLLGRLLEKEGIESVLASTGEAALEHLETRAFDILITDKNLPGITGVEVARFARRAQPGIPILMITGYASQGSARDAAALGITDYVVKPLDMEDFQTRLRAVFDERGDVPEEDPAEDPDDDLPRTVPPPRPRKISTVLRRQIMESDEASQKPVDAAIKQLEGSAELSVIIIETSDETRSQLTVIFSEIGCRVTAFGMAAQAEAQVKSAGFHVLVARPLILESRKHWLSPSDGNTSLGAIAIMEREGFDKTIEAIHMGARGVIAPPFSRPKVESEFRKIISAIMEENPTGKRDS